MIKIDTIFVFIMITFICIPKTLFQYNRICYQDTIIITLTVTLCEKKTHILTHL